MLRSLLRCLLVVVAVGLTVGCGDDKPAIPTVDKNKPAPPLNAAGSGAAKKAGPTGSAD